MAPILCNRMTCQEGCESYYALCINTTGCYWNTTGICDTLDGTEDCCLEVPTADPTVSPTRSPTRGPTTEPTFNPTLEPTIIPTMAPTHDPTYAPSFDPTTAPTNPVSTDSPTFQPSTVRYPTEHPTSAHPTERDIVVNVTLRAPVGSASYLSDPFGRFEALVSVIIIDENNVLGHGIAECNQCFVWQYQMESESAWNEFEIEDNEDISMSITRSIDAYRSILVVQSIRRLKSGNCVDDGVAANHPFEEGADYRLRMKFEIQNGNYSVSKTSKELNLSTNILPSGGVCNISNIDNLMPLEPYNLFCDFSENENGTDLEYNALIGDVMMNTEGFVNDTRKLIGIAPSGHVSITVLVKQVDEYNAISCYHFDAQFKSMDIAANETSTNSVNGLLFKIKNITNSTSLSENPDVAVAVHSVVEDLYQNNLTSQSDARDMVHNLVINILETSTVVSPINESTANISGDAIITELATVSTITSNEEIVDVESTTTVLVEEYFLDIFDAVDRFVDVSSAYNISSNITSNDMFEAEDVLYSIGEQSQDLISNLEDSVDDFIGNNDTNLTDKEVDVVNTLSESLVDFATFAASKALALSEIGETFNYEEIQYDDDGTVIKSKVVSALKFAAYNWTTTPPICGSRTRGIELPLTFMTDNVGTFDCAVLWSSLDNFIPKGDQNQYREQESMELVTANIYESPSYLRRRELSETVIHETSRCFPYLITFQLSDPSKFDLDMTLDESTPFPLRDFWNISDSYWDTEGCFVYDLVDDSVICGCTHLTTFSMSRSSIVPEANTLNKLERRDVSAGNLIKFPFVWISSLSVLLVFGAICCFNPRASVLHSRSVIAIEDSVFKSVREEKLWRDVLGKEIKILTEYLPKHDQLGQGIKVQMQSKEDRASMFSLQWQLFKVYLFSHHTVLFLFQGSSGIT